MGTYQSRDRHHPEAIVVHDVAVLDAVGAEADRVLHGVGIRRVRHHPKLALLADRERGFELVLEQERVPVAVPRRAHDAAREVELDVVDAVLDLLADRFHEAVRPVALECVTRGEEVAAGRREEMAARVKARPDKLPGIERALPGNVHEAVRAGAAQSDDA